jgi:hypothetical protein
VKSRPSRKKRFDCPWCLATAGFDAVVGVFQYAVACDFCEHVIDVVIDPWKGYDATWPGKISSIAGLVGDDLVRFMNRQRYRRRMNRPFLDPTDPFNDKRKDER